MAIETSGSDPLSHLKFLLRKPPETLTDADAGVIIDFFLTGAQIDITQEKIGGVDQLLTSTDDLEA